MKTFLMIIILVGTLVVLGWLTFTRGDGSASVTIDTDKAKQDTAAVIDKGKELAADGADAVRNAADETQDESTTP